MSKRGNCKFNEDFTAGNSFIISLQDDPFKAQCTICNLSFSVRNKGKHDIVQHISSKKHIDYAKISSHEKLDSFFKTKTLSSEDLKLIHTELVWTHHNIKHNHSLRDMDCNSELLRKTTKNNKLTCSRTKARSLMAVISNWSDLKLRKELEIANFVVIACDASNHKATKLIPVLVRYCLMNTYEIKTCVLNIHDVPNETAATIADIVLEDIYNFNIQDKVVGFVADNAAVNFGSIDKKTYCNVYNFFTERINF